MKNYEFRIENGKKVLREISQNSKEEKCFTLIQEENIEQETRNCEC